jgi:phage shock protein A
VVFARLLNLFKAKLNKGMSKLETPEVLAEQALNELESNLKKVKEAVIASMTNEKMLEGQIKKAQDDIASWEKRAAVAVEQNNDELARQCLQKKMDIAPNISGLTAQLEAQKKSTADLKARNAELDQELREFRTKQRGLVARGNASDAVAKANELLSSGPSGVGKWEQKIQEKEYKAAALQQMGQESSSAKQIQDLDGKFEVEDELAALKQKAAPKLIVDTGSGGAPAKPVVDENLPMVVEEVKKKDDKK